MPFSSMAWSKTKALATVTLTNKALTLMKSQGSNSKHRGDFPEGIEAKNPHSHCRGCKFSPWSGN